MAFVTGRDLAVLALELTITLPVVVIANRA